MADRFDHAFALGFSLISECEDASDVTHEMLRAALVARLAELDRGNANPPQGETLVEACDSPFDTFKVEP